MFDKRTEKKLQNAIENIDQNKLNEIKSALNSSGDLNSLLGKIDINKAQKKLSELNLGNIDLSNFVNELKSNPSVIDDLKKKF